MTRLARRVRVPPDPPPNSSRLYAVLADVLTRDGGTNRRPKVPIQRPPGPAARAGCLTLLIRWFRRRWRS